MQQPDRIAETPAAIERYHNALTSARGAGTGWLDRVLHLSIEFERNHGSMDRAVAAGQDLLAFQESLAGSTSEPYLHASETLAELYESKGDAARALSLRRQAVAIVDLIFNSNDLRRGYTRISTALALARQREFDEAERLATEAVGIGQSTHQTNPFSQQLEEIRRMKTGPPSGTGPSAKRDGPWFGTRIPRL